jgi:hypothetical protein
MRIGTDVITPGTRVRVIKDILAVAPSESKFIGREGTVELGSKNIDVYVKLDGSKNPLVFALGELQIIESCGYNTAPAGQPPEYCEQDTAEDSDYCLEHRYATGETDNSDEPYGE